MDVNMSDKIDLLAQLRRAVDSFIEDHPQKKMYAPIFHEEFAQYPSAYSHERFDMIRPHIPVDAQTALEIGAHWGYFSQRLEQDVGLRVTAVELSPKYASIMRLIQQVCGTHFKIVEGSILNLAGRLNYDVVIALNILHHFIKKKKSYDDLVNFLGRLQCKVMIFQAHNPDEKAMEGAYKNYNPDDFCKFLMKHAELSSFEQIGSTSKRPRPIFVLRKH
jgi:hypothetical protein